MMVVVGIGGEEMEMVKIAVDLVKRRKGIVNWVVMWWWFGEIGGGEKGGKVEKW